MHTSVVPAGATKIAPARYLSCLRLPEILVLQGSPLLGAAFALRSLASPPLEPLATLIVANMCLVAHIFVVNDCSNLSADLRDPNKAAGVFTARGVSVGEMALLAAGLLTVSLLLFSRLGAPTLAIALGIATLSALYSLPRFNWKGRPLLNSAAHLAGGGLHFLLGYSVGQAIDRRGLVIALFFAVTFAAGHLTQEVRDHQGDMRNGIRTNAVILGKRRAFLLSVILFTISQALLLALALDGALPRILAGLALLYPLQLRWSVQTLRAGLSRASICRLQSRYRTLYALVGLTVVAALWLRH